MPKPEWDIDLFRQQAQAGLQGWYVHFLADDATVGLLGPFGREDIAESIKDFYLRVEEVACDRILDTDRCRCPTSFGLRGARWCRSPRMSSTACPTAWTSRRER
jgi:hypothetical protein